MSIFSNLSRKHLIDAVWLIALMAYILAGVRIVPFHGDESTLIYMSRDYYYQFVQGDLSRILYDPAPQEAPDPEAQTQQELRLINGTVHKYFTGFLAHLSGYEIEDLNQQWLWGADYQFNLENGHIPPDELLFIGRMASALLLALGVVVIFGIGATIDGRVMAYAVSLLYAINPVILLNGRRAMMEGSLMLFSLLAVLAAMHFLRHKNWRWMLVLGLASGMAVASKHTGVITVAAVFAACGVALLWDGWRNRDAQGFPVRAFGYLIGAGVVSIVVFIALNPAWWNNPSGAVQSLLRLRSELLAGQTEFFGGYGGISDQVAGFVRQTVYSVPQYFEAEEFGTYISDQITIYESSPLRGLTLVSSIPAAIFALLIVLAGRWRMFKGDALRTSAQWIFGVWAVMVTLVTLLITPLEWQRYYLPAIPVFLLFLALGVAQLVGLAREYTRPS